jgi:hypothetical protein
MKRKKTKRKQQGCDVAKVIDTVEQGRFHGKEGLPVDIVRLPLLGRYAKALQQRGRARRSLPCSNWKLDRVLPPHH